MERTWPAELALLLGPDAGGLLEAVANAAGGTVASWRPRQVNHQVGRSTMVQYQVQLHRGQGGRTSETFVAATGNRLPGEGVAIFEDGSTRVGVWRFPHDPFLPGLPDALNPAKVAALLDRFAIDGGTLQLRTRAYRPGRRAVIEATGRQGRLFLKVVRPQRVEALHDLHRLLAARVPVPDSLGWTAEGVLVLPARPGQTLRSLLRSSQSPAPPPATIVALLDRLPAELAAQRPRQDLLSSVEHYSETIAVTVPEARVRVESLRDALTDGQSKPIPVTAVHGDLYEAQLLVERGRISGLLDIDTAGAGYRIDDLANFCAHLSVLALTSDRPRHVKRYGAALLAHAELHHDPAELRRRVAAAVLSLATGPFRVLEKNWSHNTIRRLDLAREWLDGAGARR